MVRARVAKPGTDANDTQATADAVRAGARPACSATGNFTITRTEAVGPKVGGELRQKAFLAIFLSFFAVLAYLAYRFEWRFGLAAVIATAHDILATIAFIGVLRLEVSLTVVAAVLSMVGYSLNDTIIIFDRVRENLKKHKKEPFEQILNRSINETLPRSVLTHGTTLVVAARADHLRRRGHPAVRAGHVLRRVHRHVLVHLHRLAGPHGDREALARAARQGPPGPGRRARGAGGRRRPEDGAGRVGRGVEPSGHESRAPTARDPRVATAHAHRHPLPSRRPRLRRRPGRGAGAGLGGRASRGSSSIGEIAGRPPSAPSRWPATEPRLVVTAGVHPHDAASWIVGRRGTGSASTLRRPEVVAAGEMGLDYHYDHSPRDGAARAPSRPSSPWRARRGSRP